MDWLFQHTAARRRLPNQTPVGIFRSPVSTHSRPKAAAPRMSYSVERILSFNTQPPEGGCFMHLTIHPGIIRVSTHSRPKAAARSALHCLRCNMVSTHSRPKAAAVTFRQLLPSLPRFNTQPPEGGCCSSIFKHSSSVKFQHTAARRRLHFANVSDVLVGRSFNTQPPEGGCIHLVCSNCGHVRSFNTQPPEGGCREIRRRKQVE